VVNQNLQATEEDMDTPAAIIRRLRDEIEMLDAALLARGATERPLYQPWMRNLCPQERAVVGALAGAYPGHVTRAELLMLVPSPGRDEEDRDPAIVNVLISRCRKKLGKEVIVREGWLGYSVSAEFYDALPKKELDKAA
jgi:DNA-binding response OmpR family regulator